MLDHFLQKVLDTSHIVRQYITKLKIVIPFFLPRADKKCNDPPPLYDLHQRAIEGIFMQHELHAVKYGIQCDNELPGSSMIYNG